MEGKLNIAVLPHRNMVAESSGKLRVSSGAGDPASKGSSGTVSCQDHLHPGSRRSCRSRCSETVNPGAAYLQSRLWAEADADVQRGQEQFFQTVL